jgi:hypothetical protein
MTGIFDLRFGVGVPDGLEGLIGADFFMTSIG